MRRNILDLPAAQGLEFSFPTEISQFSGNTQLPDNSRKTFLTPSGSITLGQPHHDGVACAFGQQAPLGRAEMAEQFSADAVADQSTGGQCIGTRIRLF